MRPRRNFARAFLSTIAAVFGLALVAPATSGAVTHFQGASSDGSKVFFTTGEQLVSRDTDSATDIYERSGGHDHAGLRGRRSTATVPSRRLRWRLQRRLEGLLRHRRAARQRRHRQLPDVYERSGGTTTQVSQGQINGNGALRASTSTAPRATARRSSSPPTSSWSAATPTAPATSTSAPAGPRRRSPRARSTATAPSDVELRGSPPATARRSSSRPTSSSSAPTPTAHTTSTSAPGGRRPWSPGADQRQRRLLRHLRRRLERRLEGLLHHRRAAGQRRHRQPPDIYERSGGTTTLVSAGRDQRQRRLPRDLLRGASSDGSRVFFDTDEQLVSGDTDSLRRHLRALRGDDDPGLRAQINGNGAFGAGFHGASSDGSKVFFATDEPLVSGDTDSAPATSTSAPGAPRPWSPRARSTATAPSTSASRGASSDGSQVFFNTDEQLVSGDTDSSSDIYERSGGTTTRVSQGQINGNGAFDCRLLQRRLERRLEGLLPHRRAAGQRRHRRPPATSTSAPVGSRPWSRSTPRRRPRRSTAVRAARPTIQPRPSPSPPSDPGATFQCKVDAGRLRSLQLAEDRRAPRRRLAHLLRPGQGLVRKPRRDPGHPHLHGREPPRSRSRARPWSSRPRPGPRTTW